MRIKFIYLSILLTTFILTFIGCKKDDDIILPEPDALFLARPATGSYTIATANTVHIVRVGLTTPSNQTLTYSVNVSSPTGAVAGTHYTLSKNTITFAPGQVLDSFEVRGVYDQYLSGRKDELVITLAGNESASSELTKTYRLNLSGPCFEGDVDLDDLLGDYNNSMESWYDPAGPYKTTVTAVNLTSPTTGTITVSGIRIEDQRLSVPLTFQLDWTNPANRTVVLSPAPVFDLGELSSWGYDDHNLLVTSTTAAQGPGTFSVCNETITLKMRVGLRGPDYPNGVAFGAVYNLQMAR